MNTLEYLDIGGGLGVSYDDEESPDLDRFAHALTSRVQPTGLTLLMEPGRFIVGNAGVLLTRVLYRKRSGGREFLITDAGMTELLRPSHYDAYHRIEAVQPSRAADDGRRRRPGLREWRLSRARPGDGRCQRRAICSLSMM